MFYIKAPSLPIATILAATIYIKIFFMCDLKWSYSILREKVINGQDLKDAITGASPIKADILLIFI